MGDKVVVGPGTYRGESGAPGCSCFVAVNKLVTLVSSDGAAATVIDATGFLVQTNVLVIADGSEFGKPGKGFTVRTCDAPDGTGIAIDAKHVKIRGNQVIGPTFNSGTSSPGAGIVGVTSNPGPMLIKGNQVMFWGETGILARGDGKKVVGNQVSMVNVGIEVEGTSTATGNVVTDDFIGIQLLGGAGRDEINRALGVPTVWLSSNGKHDVSIRKNIASEGILDSHRRGTRLDDRHDEPVRDGLQVEDQPVDHAARRCLTAAILRRIPTPGCPATVSAA